MPYAIEVHLQLVNLPQYLVELGDLLVGHCNRVAGAVVLLLGHHLRLFGEIVEACLDLLEQAVEVSAQLGEGLVVEEEQALGGRERGGARGRRASCGGLLLVMPQQGDFIIGQAELRVGHRVLWDGHRGWWCSPRPGMRAGRGTIVGVVDGDEGNDTLTESCEGAVNFMVIEIRVGSWQELPVVISSLRD